ncbi:MAG: potassium transporter Trk [Synergistales bacterium]|nr:potassium transporter Trk [Synergistales bacterium]
MNPAGLVQWIKSLSPAQTLILYYAAAIATGTALLATPPATNGTPLSFIDALFTATSAQCVTGLIVVDTGTKLSLFGQSVVLVLIQIGGWGIMTFSVFLFLYLRMDIRTRERWIIHETLLHSPVSSWKELVKEIIVLTATAEIIGTILLSLVFVPEMGIRQGTYCALFHAISAFCNAGFSLFSDSMVGYRDSALMNITIMSLIILGGIGFLVIRELLGTARESFHPKIRPKRLSLHSKLVLGTTAFLIIAGTGCIGWLEAAFAFGEMHPLEGMFAAIFQSVTARTAGFNTVGIGTLRTPTLFALMILMFIGASPGSAGGGVKTTCLAIFAAAFYNRIKRTPHINVFRRTIPEENLSRALLLILLAVTIIAGSLFALLSVQTPGPPDGPAREFLFYTFEIFSAFGTVGLSMGATGELGSAGKMIIIFLMFTGRVGLLTLAYAIGGRIRRSATRYAEENIMIG